MGSGGGRAEKSDNDAEPADAESKSAKRPWWRLRKSSADDQGE